MTSALLNTETERREPVGGGRAVAFKCLSVAIVAALWLVTSCVFFRGFVGSDDLFYSRYAFLLHRPPMNYWEFRIPAVMAIRASFFLLGPTEFAAALPTILASLSILVSVAWFVGWPKRLTWQTQLSMLLTVMFPLDLGFRSIPGANYFSCGFLALGTASLLKGRRWTPFFGAALLSLAFITHEITFFYTAILCLITLAFDWRRFWPPILACIVISACGLVAECMAYQQLLGDPLARFRASGTAAAGLLMGYDPDTGIGGIRFFTWPVLENLLFSRACGFYLLALLLGGLAAWKTFAREQRILFLAVFVTWAWIGYGTPVPWVYRPFCRQVHLYGFLVFGVGSLLPAALGYVFTVRRKLACGVIFVAVGAHLAGFFVGGHYAQEIRVSRQLLRYANEHRGQVFLTDVQTMNLMYAYSGFQLPENVVCLNGPTVESRLLVNKEPPGSPRFRFPEPAVDGVLVNLEMLARHPVEAEFLAWLKKHPGGHERIVPLRYRPMCRPLLAFMQPTDFMIASQGGEVMWLPKAPHPFEDSADRSTP